MTMTHDAPLATACARMMTTDALTVSAGLWADAGADDSPWPAAITVELARRHYCRAARALQAGELAEVPAPVLDALEIQAADAYARYATLASLR